MNHKQDFHPSAQRSAPPSALKKRGLIEVRSNVRPDQRIEGLAAAFVEHFGDEIRARLFTTKNKENKT